jgi:hypothetical protein
MGGNYSRGTSRSRKISGFANWHSYWGRIFHPEGHEGQDISAAPEFEEMCRKMFGVEGWAWGDTGGWFGL